MYFMSIVQWDDSWIQQKKMKINNHSIVHSIQEVNTIEIQQQYDLITRQTAFHAIDVTIEYSKLLQEQSQKKQK
jgi:hypothetical protein